MAIRETRQRNAIRQVLNAAEGPLSPLEVLQAAQQHVPQLGIATVYRALIQLQDEGVIQSVSVGGESRYECTNRGHHHHFFCQQCRRVFDLHGCGFKPSSILPPGFLALEHEILIAGRCSGCVAADGQ